MKTRAAVLYDINKPLVVENLEIPKLNRGQVLVKILFSGICRSQLNEIQGKNGIDRFLPHTLGHEGSGVVERVGTDVTHVKPGDYVVLSWIKGVGVDTPSAFYLKDGKKINSGAISTFNTYSIISENRLNKIPKEMPTDMAALLGCAVPTGAGIIKNTIKAKKNDSVAIFGIGGIGSSALISADMKKCFPIIAVDVNNEKLKLAKELGATHIINPRKEDVTVKIMEITNNKSVDYSIESSGVKEVMETAFDVIKNTGTTVIAGNLKHGERISIDPSELIKGKKIIGTWGGETKPERDIPLYVNMYLSGKLKLDKLVTRRYRLDDINNAFKDLKNSKVIRPLIDMSYE